MGSGLRINRRLVVLGIIALLLTSVIWVPALVFAASGQPEKFQYYVKALEYGLKGLQQYFQFIIELFKAAVSG